MATFLDLLLRNADNIGFQLVPHVEEAAMQYVIYNTVMPSRVLVRTDMSGWNVRKVSEYLRSRRAQDLLEDTDIPDTNLIRVRKNQAEPKEVGDRYRVTNRRSETDPESILTDVVSAIGEAIRERVEVDLFSAGLNSFKGGLLGSSSTAWSLGLMLQAATIFRARARHGALFHVVHPYQALSEMEKLIQYTGTTQEANLQFRDNAASQIANSNDIRSINLPTFGVSNLAISELIPRKVVYKISVLGDGGTFRLQLGNGYDSATPKNITGAITVSVTPATMVTNIQDAIDALDMSDYYSGSGSFVVSGTAIDDITVTPPSDFYIDDPSGLRIATKYDEDASVVGDLGVHLQKSAYDLVTNPDGTVVDMNGASLGVAMYERSGVCRALMFKPDAILWDIRNAVQSFFELTKQGRTAEFSGYMVYAAQGWHPENGMFVETIADSPLATG
jgi:hypothetical protein